MYYAKECKILVKDERVILANRATGEWIKISKECYGILNIFLKKNKKLKDVCNVFSQEDDKSYFEKLLFTLMKMKLISEGIEIPSKKRRIYFNLTYRCNLQCAHCCVDAKHVSEFNEGDEMDTEDIKKSLDKIFQYNPDTLIFSGGEPLVRTDFTDLLKYVESNYHGEVILATNGVLINKYNINSLLRVVSRIDISLDGVDEKSCMEIRGKGTYQKVIDVVDLLHDFRFLNISLSMVITDRNRHLKDKFIKLNERLKTKYVLRAYEAIGRGKDNEDRFLSHNAFNHYQEIDKVDIKELQKETKCITCDAGTGEIMIDPLGYVFPCGNLSNVKYRMGNILKIHDLGSYLNSDEMKNTCGYWKLKEMQPYNNLKCKDCNVNLFCWSCISSKENEMQNEIQFKTECSYRKRILNQVVWAE